MLETRAFVVISFTSERCDTPLGYLQEIWTGISLDAPVQELYKLITTIQVSKASPQTQHGLPPRGCFHHPLSFPASVPQLLLEGSREPFPHHGTVADVTDPAGLSPSHPLHPQPALLSLFFPQNRDCLWLYHLGKPLAPHCTLSPMHKSSLSVNTTDKLCTKGCCALQ